MLHKVHGGDLTYASRSLDLYKAGLDSRVLFEDKYLSRFTFDNIVGMGLRVRDFDWTGAFMEKYVPSLQPEYRTGAYNLNLARLHFAKENYDKAIVHLRKSDYDDVLNNILSRVVLMKIYYEKDEVMALESQLDAIKAYVLRKKLIGQYQTNFLNIVKYTRKLVGLLPGDKGKHVLLERAIRNESVLTERLWLLEKVAELK